MRPARAVGRRRTACRLGSTRCGARMACKEEVRRQNGWAVFGGIYYQVGWVGVGLYRACPELLPFELGQFERRGKVW